VVERRVLKGSFETEAEMWRNWGFIATKRVAATARAVSPGKITSTRRYTKQTDAVLKRREKSLIRWASRAFAKKGKVLSFAG
jgi:hypothetical protein